MARSKRLVVPGEPHHVTQRGNRREQVFFTPADRRLYLMLLKAAAESKRFQVWAYCLMDNHVHLIVVPELEDSLTKGLAEVHSMYSRHINFRNGWKGHIWQGPFYSCVLDEAHLIAAVRYVETNPVRAGLVGVAEAYPWSSARAHAGGEVDPILSSHFLTTQFGDWSAFLKDDPQPQVVNSLRRHTRTGRALGSAAFLTRLEHHSGRRVAPRRPGRPGQLPPPQRSEVADAADALGK